MTEYQKQDYVVEQLIGKSGIDSPVSTSTKLRASSNHGSGDNANVRNSLAQRFMLKDSNQQLESTAAIAKLLGGATSNSGVKDNSNTYTTYQLEGNSAAPTVSTNQYTSTLGTAGAGGYNTTTTTGLYTPSSNIAGYTGLENKYDYKPTTSVTNGTSYNGGISGLDSYKYDYQVNPITTTTTTTYGTSVPSYQDYTYDSKATPATTSIPSTVNYTSGLTDYKYGLPSTTSATTGINGLNTYTPSYVPQSYTSGNVGMRSSYDSPRKMEEYFPITDSKQLIKDQSQTKQSAIVEKIDSFMPKNQDIYGSLQVNNQFKYGGSISGVTSIRDTMLLPGQSITGNVRESVTVNPSLFSNQISNSPRAVDSKVYTDQQKIQGVLSKFASYQPTPQGGRTSMLKNSTSQANLVSSPIKTPTESVEETLKRASNAIRQSMQKSSSTNDINNNIGGLNAESTSNNYAPVFSSSTYQPLLTSNTYTATTPIVPTSTLTTTTAQLTSNPIYTPITTNIPTYTTNAYVTTQPSATIKSVEVVDVYSTNWQSIIQRGEREGIEFSDSEFLPSPANIGGKYLETVEWLRPREIFNSGYEVFVKGIDPTTLIPGDLGDTYFQGAISALAERDYSILKLFQTKSVNKAGCYVLNICWKGVWTQVILDDRFPTKSNRQICFTRSSSNELWAILLEKAWAKLHGSYAKIDGGLIREVLHDFTGAPCRTFFTSGEGFTSRVSLWDRIQHAEDKDLVVLATCMDDLFSTEQEQIRDLYGISNTHPYTILGTICLRYQNSDFKFVKLRNPNVKQEWQHMSEDKYYNQLPQDVINQLNYGGRCTREGFFLMEFEHFYKFFTDVQICYQFLGFQYTGEKLCTMRAQKNYYKIEVNQPGYYFFQVSQQSIRTERISDQMTTSERDYYSQVYLVIASESNPTKPIIAVTGNQRDLTSNFYIDNPVFIPQGEYFAYIEVDWQSNKSSSGNCGFGAYGSNYIEIRATNNTQCSEFANYVNKIINDNSQWEQV